MSLDHIVNRVAAENAAIRHALEVFAEHEWLRQSCAEKGIPISKPETANTMAAITAIVAARHGLTVEELREPGRSRYVAYPRQEAMWMMRQVKTANGEHRFSLPQIGRYLGGRDHTTVLHGVKAHEARALAKQEAA
jgi:chromosomal replication initiation ATPase DnaA